MSSSPISLSVAWSNPHSIERLTGQAFAEALIKSMQVRVQNDQDVTDLVIGGVEVSLWMAEQWAADLRRVFPNLNITTTSTNKYVSLVSRLSISPLLISFAFADYPVR
jgi:hypothetical protein